MTIPSFCLFVNTIGFAYYTVLPAAFAVEIHHRGFHSPKPWWFWPFLLPIFLLSFQPLRWNFSWAESKGSVQAPWRNPFLWLYSFSLRGFSHHLSRLADRDSKWQNVSPSTLCVIPDPIGNPVFLPSSPRDPYVVVSPPPQVLWKSLHHVGMIKVKTLQKGQVAETLRFPCFRIPSGIKHKA